MRNRKKSLREFVDLKNKFWENFVGPKIRTYETLVEVLMSLLAHLLMCILDDDVVLLTLLLNPISVPTLFLVLISRTLSQTGSA